MTERAAIVQSSFLPWRGFFDMMDDVDVFYIYDDVAFTSKSWRSRNRIKTARGPSWITVPTVHAWPRNTIDETEINNDQDWRSRILSQITEAYRQAPYFQEVFPELERHLGAGYRTVSELNVALVRWAAERLSIGADLRFTRDLGVSGKGEDRVMSLLDKAGIKWLVNGPTAKQYSTVDLYRERGISLSFMQYDYPEYPQLHGAFTQETSIIDLFFNTGPDARRYLKSTLPQEIAYKA